MNYDSFKWIITKEFVYAYRYKEGQCYIFENDSIKVKDFVVNLGTENNTAETSYNLQGSYLKTVTSARLNKVYNMTYNNKLRKYFLIPGFNSLVLQSIIIADTQEYSSRLLHILNLLSLKDFCPLYLIIFMQNELLNTLLFCISYYIILIRCYFLIYIL
jgi:hypothetical protein